MSLWIRTMDSTRVNLDHITKIEVTYKFKINGKWRSEETMRGDEDVEHVGVFVHAYLVGVEDPVQLTGQRVEYLEGDYELFDVDEWINKNIRSFE